MDSKGLINIELLFCTIIIIMILIINIPFLEHSLDSSKELNENSNGRILLESLSNSINQVNSNKIGYSKKIKLPQTINGYYYTVLIHNNEVILEFNNKKARSNIQQINIVDSENQSLENVQLFNGRTYIIKKILANNNQSNIINQSSILIRQVAG